MKILVFSDTHRMTDRMIEIAQRENANMFIHLGDCVSDGERLWSIFPQTPITQVKGNNDFFENVPYTQTVEVCGVKIFICHGHTLGVKNSLYELESAARRDNAQIALYGHTHIPSVDFSEGLWVMNPGTAAGIGTGKTTYGVIKIENGKVDLFNKMY